MGTALLFLILLDAIILTGVYGSAKLEIAIAVSALVLALIAFIWSRNLKLEKMAPPDKASASG